MLSSREVMQLENQRFYMANTVPVSRQLNNKPQSSELVLNSVPQTSNLAQGIGTHMPVSNASTVQCSTQNSSSSVYNSFYSSSTFNSINNFEASLQWLTESRIPSNGLLSEKNLNCSSHSTPSHSCCVNRLGGVDNVGMCSPLSGDSYRSSRDTINYQTKPPALSVNVIDSVQNWFNLPPLPNQQYGSKFNDQSMNCSQINLPMIEQTDLKQNDICLQISDSYFDQPLNNNGNGNSRQGNGIGELNNGKINDTNELTISKTFNNSYQTNIISRDSWKQPLQTAASYISSPTLFNSLNDSPDHYLYSLPPPTTSSSSYCMVSDNISNINNKLSQNNCIQQNLDKQQSVINSRLMPCIDQHLNSQGKVTNQPHIHQVNHNLVNHNRNEKSLQIDHRISADIKITGTDASRNTQNSNCNLSNGNIKHNGSNSSYAPVFMTTGNANGIHDSNRLVDKKLADASKDNSNIIEITDETTSGSEESNIIVEESDDMEEMDSVISINEIKKSYVPEEPVELRCLVCNVKSSTQTPTTQFIHMNDSFPLTSASKTPVASKLIQILPVDLQHFLKLHNSFMCRRCLNLIETVEVLEVKLTSVKQTLSESFSKTVQYFLPATPIVEIENGTAKIIDKEIITCIEKSTESDSVFSESPDLTGKTQKNNTKTNELEESENEVFDEDDYSDDEDDDDDDWVEDECNKQNVANSSPEGIQCRICTKLLSSMKVFKKHMQLHTKCFSFYCEYCGKGFNLKQSLEKHVKLHSEDSRYQCEKCGKTYSQKHRLDNHLKRHLGEFKLNCKECGKGFMEKQPLDDHMRSHMNNFSCICEICGSKFSKESNLKAHLQICKKEEIKCTLCPEVFYSKTHLKKHEMMIHGAKPGVDCKVCGKIFVNVKDLKPHLRSHMQEKPFECKVCGKQYKSVSNLNHHAKMHDVTKLLKCTLCGEGFSRKQLLEDHMNKHSGERVYKCNKCGKDFYDRDYLQRHIRTHSDTVKLKPCQICGKKFRIGLKVHMRTHTGVKPYVCSHCGHAFTVSSALSRHIQSKHQNVFES